MTTTIDATGTGPRTDLRKVKRAATAAFLGSMLEYYEFYIYASAAALVFGKVFFPSSSAATGTLLSLATFGVAYIARPIGAVLLGHLGDRVGRKKIMLFTLGLMGTATFLIGCLPEYKHIGIWAPILLVCLRVCQGISAAGEQSGANSLTLEHSPEHRRAFFTSWTLTGTQAGFILATLVFLSVATLPEDQLLSWGWRIPFLASAVVVFAAYIARRKLEEPEVFTENRENGELERFPVATLLRTHSTDVLRVILCAFQSVGGTIFAVFGLAFATSSEVGISRPTMLWAAVVANVVALVMQPSLAHGIAHAYDDLEALLGSGLDAVTICTPHPTHEAIVIAAAEHGLHVLCEKPIAITLDEADRMVEATAAAGVKFGVLFQRRFWPAAQRIRTAIDAGDLGGAPIVATCTVRLGRDREYYTSDPWRGRWDTDGGGVLMTQAIHYIDMLQWFMGDAVEVTGHVDTLVHGDYIEVEDTVAATVKFSSGGLATITAGTTFAPGLGTQIVVGGRNGHTVSLTEFPEGTPAVNDIWTVAGEEEYRQMHSTAIESDPPLSKIHVGLVPFHQMQIEDFVHAIVEDRAPAVSGRDARRALEIVLAIYESSRTGQPVTLTSGALAGLQ